MLRFLPASQKRVQFVDMINSKKIKILNKLNNIVTLAYDGDNFTTNAWGFLTLLNKNWLSLGTTAYYNAGSVGIGTSTP